MMKKNCSTLAVLAFSCFFLTGCFFLTETASDNCGRVLTVEEFKNFTKINPPQFRLPALKKAEIDLDRLKSCDIPVTCMIDYDSLPNDYKLEKREDGFLIGSAHNIILLGACIFPTRNSYIIEAQVRVPQECSLPESTLKLGVRTLGLRTTDTRFAATKKLAPGEKRTLTAAVQLTDNFGPFHPAFEISGDIVFEKVKIYEQNRSADDKISVVEGTIAELSPLPDPKTSNYPDCRFTCHFKGNAILSGKSCPQNVSLLVDGFLNYQLLPTKTLKPGDKVICLVMPFDKLSQEMQSIQQADELNLFSLENYYAVGLYRVKNFQEIPGGGQSGVSFAGGSNADYISVFDRHINPPLNQEEKRKVGNDIARELQKVENMLVNYTPEQYVELQKKFTQIWQAEQAKDKPGYNRIVRKNVHSEAIEYVWRNIDDSFWALPTNYQLKSFQENPIRPANLKALIALRDFLEANGVQLLIAPIPEFQEIAARVINPALREVPDFFTATMVRQLLKNGIWTFYPSDELLRNFNRYEWAFFYPFDDHTSDTTQDVVTDLTSRKLALFSFSPTLDAKLFGAEWAPHRYGNDRKFFLPANCDIGNKKPNTAYNSRRILYDGKKISPDPTSPVLVIGNSFMQSPGSYPLSCSFPTLLCSKLRLSVDLKALSGGFAPMTTFIKQLLCSPEILQSKKVLVLVMAVQHFSTNFMFNDIREMDEQLKQLSGKEIVEAFSIPPTPEKNIAAKYPGLANPNFVEVSAQELTLLDTTLNKTDHGKPVIVVLPTYAPWTTKVKYLINGVEVAIFKSGGGNKVHENTIYELPAGTSCLKIEVLGKPGDVLSIRNIQIWQ